MKRFAFFMAVFSVSLVLLLVCTGQLGKLFDDSDLDDAPPPHVSRAPLNPTDPSQQNRIVFPSIDLERGRNRWVVSGRVTKNASLNPENWGRAQTLTDAYVEIPIYGSSGGQQMRLFRLDAQRVAFDRQRVDSLDEDQEEHTGKVELEGGVKGRGDDGTTFDTQALTLGWVEKNGDGADPGPDVAETVTLTGDQPVSFSYPTALRLHGEGGLYGELGDKGLSHLTVLPPVVVAVEQARAKGFMGLEKQASATPGEVVEVIILYSEQHPLVIDAQGRKARFTGEVTLYRTEISPTRALFPAPEVTDTWLQLRDLELGLSQDSMRFIRAEARGRGADGLIRARYGDLYTLAGEHLVWDDGDAQATLTGKVRLTGPLGTFRARQASLYPHEERAVLEGDLTAELEQPAEPPRPGDKDDKARDARKFRFRADRLEIAYRGKADADEKAPAGDGVRGVARRVRELTATAKRANGVEIVEIEPSGLVVRGSVVRYEQEEDRFVALPRAGEAVRPVLESESGRVVADRIDVSLSRRELSFEGVVEGRLGSARTAATGGFLSTLRCGTLVVGFAENAKGDMDVDDVRVTGAAELHNVGASGEPFHAFGEEIHWQRGDQHVRLTGTEARPARLTIEGGEFRAREIVYDIGMQRATANGDVQVRTARVVPPKLLAADERAAAASTELVVRCDHFEGMLTEVATAAPKNGAGGHGAPDLEQARLRTARAWCDEDRRVVASCGEFTGEAGELRYDGETGVLELTGEGRPRIAEVGERGRDQLSALEIRVSPGERWVELDGDVQATVFLEARADAKRRPGGRRPGAQPPAERGAFTPWLLGARTARVTFVEVERAGRGGARRVLEPERVTASEVVLDNEELEVHAEGSQLAWNRDEQKLRMYSEDGTRRQTFHRGRGELRDEVLAREVSLVLVPEGADGEPGHLNVLLDDVPDAIFHHREDPRDARSGPRATGMADGKPVPAAAQVPEQYRLRTDHLLLVVERRALRGRGGPGPDEAPVREALAWGRVLFEGGRYRVTAGRCRYQGNPERLFFYGETPDPVRVSVAGRDAIQGNPVILRKSERGYEVETKGRYPWRGEELREFLRLHREESEE